MDSGNLSMNYHRYEVLPWIIIFVTALLILAFFAWLGFDGWKEL